MLSIREFYIHNHEVRGALIPFKVIVFFTMFFVSRSFVSFGVKVTAILFLDSLPLACDGRIGYLISTTFNPSDWLANL